MKRSGYADLPLHYGKVPPWLYERMGQLGGAVVETIIQTYGQSEVLKRLSDPFWFQALGCVMGMDWHSSGITTSVLGALKRAVNPISRELGIYFCGGKGRFSRRTPDEITEYSARAGIDGDGLVNCSRLSAKVDSTAVQDGFQIYLHTFIVSEKGEWTVVQQGLNENMRMARRYHWHSGSLPSGSLQSFVREPHTAVVGRNLGKILNLVHSKAETTQKGILGIVEEPPGKMLEEARRIILPRHHDVRRSDVQLKRLGSVLAVAHDASVRDFSSLLLTRGLGPRTLQSLTLVSEVIHGTPSRFEDPARFSFAHGGKDGHPFPVPTAVYDRTIEVLRESISRAKIGQYDKMRALKRLAAAVVRVETQHDPTVDFDGLLDKERRESPRHGGRTVFD